jgi:hypothetical protein
LTKEKTLLSSDSKAMVRSTKVLLEEDLRKW